MKHEDLKDVLSNCDYLGQFVTVCGWVKTVRKSKNTCFVELNDGTTLNNIQLVIEPNLFNSLNELKVGTSIEANGLVVKSLNSNQNIEIKIENLQIIGYCPSDYPIQKKKQSLENLRYIPHLRAKTNTFNAVFRVRSVIAMAIHEYFQQHNFIYINTPILTGSNCEGAGEMFRATTLDIDNISKNSYNPFLDKDDFFGKRVNLTLSGQLEAEALACGLGKVYTFGPSFRAENSNTKHHAAEFWLIEPEVAFADLNDIMEIVIDLVKNIFQKVLSECSQEIDFFTKYYDSQLYCRLLNVVQDNFITIDYTEVINILMASNQDFIYPIYWGCDLKSEHIKYLLNIYQAPVFVINYPKELKPFYTKINPDGITVASADLFFPGIGDIIGACQKEENYELLEKRIIELYMTKEDYLWYLDLRKYGTVPHSGFGIGLERLTMYATGMENIRDTIPFPRTKCKNLKI